MSNFYQSSVPILINYLKNVKSIIEKTVKHADANGIKHEDILEGKLAPDMRGLIYQIQSCANTAKHLAVRVGQSTEAALLDNETTFAELLTLIDTAISILERIDAEKYNANASQQITFSTSSMGDWRSGSGYEYVFGYAFGNFHFHMSTAYAIIRHLGIPLNAFDYLSGTIERAPKDA